MTSRGAQYLWIEVLHAAIEDALHGVSGLKRDVKFRLQRNIAAREYVTVPNTDFDEVCFLAGFDPETVRTRLQAKLKNAPTPEELVSIKRNGRRGEAITFNGQSRSITEWADHISVAPSLIANRLKNGWPIERVLTPAHVKGQPKARCEKDLNRGTGLSANFSKEIETGVCADSQEIEEIRV